MHVAEPPVLLTNVIDDVGDAIALLEQEAPYTPLGGWYNPGADPHARTRPMWFQNDWVHDGTEAPGSELFLHHPAYIDAAKAYYDAEIVEPHSVYVNHMLRISAAGPAHTDNPRFAGRDRANTPMWLLRAMYWSDLFRAEAIPQATAIWWLNDVEGGALRYWPDGPAAAPVEHVGAMANTALIGDNHGMFHQVGPVGPYDDGTPLVSPRAQLEPVGDGTDWRIVDHDEEVVRTPLDRIRVSVLWKADVFRDAEEQRRLRDEPLSIDAVAARLNDDLCERGATVRLDTARLDDPATAETLREVYAEPRPVDVMPSVFDR